MYITDPLLMKNGSVSRFTSLPTRWVFVGVWCWVFAIHTLFYLLLVPPWQVPDEPTSVELLLTMQAKGRLVRPADKDPAIEQEIIASMDRSRYWELGSYGHRPEGRAATFEYIYPCCHTQLHRPALYHALMLPAAYLTDPLPLEQRLLVFRSLTMLLGIATVSVVALISYELLSVHAALPLVLPALVAFHPQFAYSSAGFNSDNLVALLGALLFLVLIRLLRYGFTPLRLALLVTIVAVGFLSKRTMLFVLPSLAIAVFWQMVQSWRHGSKVTRGVLLLASLSGILVLSVIVTVPLIRNVVLTVLKQIVFQAGLAHYRSFVFDRLIWLPPWLPISIPFLNRSFWGSFGWHQIFIPDNLQDILLWFVGISWLSACIGITIRRRQIPRWSMAFLWNCFLAIAVALVITLINAPQGILPQGRYLFVVLVPIMTLIALGLVWWVPRRLTIYVVGLIWIALVMLDAYTLSTVVIPGFYR